MQPFLRSRPGRFSRSRSRLIIYFSRSPIFERSSILTFWLVRFSLFSRALFTQAHRKIFKKSLKKENPNSQTPHSTQKPTSNTFSHIFNDQANFLFSTRSFRFFAPLKFYHREHFLSNINITLPKSRSRKLYKQQTPHSLIYSTTPL